MVRSASEWRFTQRIGIGTGTTRGGGDSAPFTAMYAAAPPSRSYEPSISNRMCQPKSCKVGRSVIRAPTPTKRAALELIA